MARFLAAALDASRAADAAMQARELFGDDHEIIVLLVVRRSLLAATTAESSEMSSDRFEMTEQSKPDDVLATASRAEADARSELEDALRRLHLKAHVRVRVEIGDPGETFCRVALEDKADLIVLGRRNRTLASRLRVGSVTHYVLEHAQCPVLVVHEKAN
jgi:nucleotide-binding universal stress UspA family protein